ncbi:MAG: DUF2062 domain-containing protein [Cyanobacteria bacterium P01_H01_bin.119]
MPSHRANSKALKNPWRRRLRYLYLRFIRMRGSTREIARGIAAGVFAGLFPLFGLQTIIGVVLAAMLRGNKIMAAAATWVSNPFTYVPIYFFNYRVGRFILGNQTRAQAFDDADALKSWTSMGADITVALFLGCFVMGLACAFVSYFLGLHLTRWIRQRTKPQAKQG